jgi:hypothetical protein
MRATRARVSCSSASAVPNSRRDVANATASSSARRAKPSAAAPTVERNTSSVPSATRIPFPGSPTRRVASTRQPSKRIVPNGCGASVSMRAGIETPGSSGVTTSATYPSRRSGSRGRPARRQKTTYWSAIPAFEIHVFSPSITQPSPSGRAVVRIAAMSEPASASEMANAAIASPAATGGSQRARCASVP